MQTKKMQGNYVATKGSEPTFVFTSILHLFVFFFVSFHFFTHAVSFISFLLSFVSFLYVSVSKSLKGVKLVKHMTLVVCFRFPFAFVYVLISVFNCMFVSLQFHCHTLIQSGCNNFSV